MFTTAIATQSKKGVHGNVSHEPITGSLKTIADIFKFPPKFWASIKSIGPWENLELSELGQQLLAELTSVVRSKDYKLTDSHSPSAARARTVEVGQILDRATRSDREILRWIPSQILRIRMQDYESLVHNIHALNNG
jgi:hypothetical protein